MDQAGRRLLPLDGHGQGSDGEFGAPGISHRPADDFAGEEIQYGQIGPPFGGWHVGDVGQPNLIRACRHEGLFEQIRGDRQVVMAVRGAHPKRSPHAWPDAVMTHEPFDATAARRMPLGAQGRGNPGRAVSPAMCRGDPPDLA